MDVNVADQIRVIAWNIRAGGGRRIEEIARQISCWSPDIVVLSEFRGTPASEWLKIDLASQGLGYQLSTVDKHQPAINSLLVASRWTIEPIYSRLAPKETGRWLLANVNAPLKFKIGAMHVPNHVTGRKYQFHESVLSLARRWLGGPAMLIGDTNTGRIGLDEETSVFSQREENWMLGLEAAGWHDAFRQIYGDLPAFTWYSPNGNNGFRLDEAFVHSSLVGHLQDARYEWGKHREDPSRRDALSDHAAMLVDLRS